MATLEDACGDDPSWSCEWVFERTHNAFLSGAVDWLFARPLTIVAILLGAAVVSRFSRWFIKRLMGRVRGSRSEGRVRWLRDRTPSVLLHTEEWSLRADARVQTLTAVIRSVASIIIWFTAVFLVLSVIGVNVRALVAGTAVLGVALGFGAQNVVRDFLAGFFLVVEDQFGVGDIVDLGGDVRGTVEKITLRMTRLRDVNGTVWHIPNGEIRRVGNKSQEWARALLDIEVDANADYGDVQAIVNEIATTMATEPDWAVEILEPPEVWGIESFTAEGYVVRLVVKTRPASQFGVMRELRIRLKAAFDNSGVQLPATRREFWIHTEPAAERRQVNHTPSGENPSVHPRRGDPSEA